MTDFWDDPNIGEGASRFSLGPLGVNTDDPYQAVTATMTAGQVIAGIVLDRDDQPYSGTGNSVVGGYPAGINVAN